MPREEYSGSAITLTLDSGIDNVANSFTSAEAPSNWPTGLVAGPFVATLGDANGPQERIKITSRSGSAFSGVTRGYDGTSAQAWAPGTKVRHTNSAAKADELDDHVFDTSRDDHSQYLTTARHDIEARHAFGAGLGVPGAPVSVGTANATGSGDDAAREDHVHELGVGSIDASNLFVAGVVDQAAIGTNAVGADELANNAVDTAAIADTAVTSPKLHSSAFGGTAEIADVGTTEAAGASGKVADAAHVHDLPAAVLADVATETGSGFDAANTTITNDTVSVLDVFQDYGTEVATIANPGRQVAVMATCTANGTGTGTAGPISMLKVGISLDGGSSYTFGPNSEGDSHQAAVGRLPLGAQHFRTGTPSGDIKVKAQIAQNAGTAGDITWTGGHIMVWTIPI